MYVLVAYQLALGKQYDTGLRIIRRIHTSWIIYVYVHVCIYIYTYTHA